MQNDAAKTDNVTAQAAEVNAQAIEQAKRGAEMLKRLIGIMERQFESQYGKETGQKRPATKVYSKKFSKGSHIEITIEYQMEDIEEMDMMKKYVRETLLHELESWKER